MPKLRCDLVEDDIVVVVQLTQAGCGLKAGDGCDLMRPPSPSIPEKQFVHVSLPLDGRAQLEQRVPVPMFGAGLGSVECALGQTRCVIDATRLAEVAQVDARVVRPPPRRSFQGLLSIHSEI